jgi:hypothetical protein
VQGTNQESRHRPLGLGERESGTARLREATDRAACDEYACHAASCWRDVPQQNRLDLLLSFQQRHKRQSLCVTQDIRDAPMPVSWKDLILAFEFVGASNTEENQVFLCKQTGELHWHSDSLGELDELPDDIDDDEKYVQLPDKRELDLGKPLVFDFVRQFLPADFDEVQRIFSRKGAYARFKDLLVRRGTLDQWYAFEEKAEEDALRRWCELNSIEIDDKN